MWSRSSIGVAVAATVALGWAGQARAQLQGGGVEPLEWGPGAYQGSHDTGRQQASQDGNGASDQAESHHQAAQADTGEATQNDATQDEAAQNEAQDQATQGTQDQGTGVGGSQAQGDQFFPGQQGREQGQGANGQQVPTLRQQLRSDVNSQAAATDQQIDQLRIVRLTVRSVDPVHHRVTFDAQVSPGASFRAGQGAQIGLDQLQPGEQVRAALDPSTGDVVAVEVINPNQGSKGNGAQSASGGLQGQNGGPGLQDQSNGNASDYGTGSGDTLEPQQNDLGTGTGQHGTQSGSGPTVQPSP